MNCSSFRSHALVHSLIPWSPGASFTCLTHAARLVQGIARLTGAAERALGVQALAVLTNALHGALVYVCESDRKIKKERE